MSDQLEIRSFNIREANWHSDKNTLSNLRRIVFIVEQNVPQHEEWDGLDDDAWHWLATDEQDRPMGTARLLPSGQIGRMAVLSEYRGKNIGQALLEQAVLKAQHLGFNDVYLNAQAHALGFYERSGFVIAGEEFEEAGIAHFRMEKTLLPLAAISQRKLASGSVSDITLQQFDISEVSWQQQGKIIRTLRRNTFVNEMGLDQNLIEDDDDLASIHFQAKDDAEQTIGCITMTTNGDISRLAVDANFRRQGVGQSLIGSVTFKAQRFGIKEVNFIDRLTNAAFYASAGFANNGESFKQDGQVLQRFSKKIEPVESIEKVTSSTIADHYQSRDAQKTEASHDEPTYRLGEDNRLLLLRKEEEFRQVIVEMCKQAVHSLRILSPVLDHKLFDNDELMEICSALARRNRYTEIQILLYDPHRVIKNGHALLEISRRLSSSISIKLVHPELRQLNHEYILVDGEGIIHRQDSEAYEGSANFRDVTENNRFGRQFRSRWESGLFDPNLRRLKI
jgi:predicted GNAT family N-acyltransferase